MCIRDRHGYDYSVIPMFSGILEIDDGKTINKSKLELGKPYFRKKGVKHDVINGNDFACSFIEVEYLESYSVGKSPVK